MGFMASVINGYVAVAQAGYVLRSTKGEGRSHGGTGQYRAFVENGGRGLSRVLGKVDVEEACKIALGARKSIAIAPAAGRV